MQKIGRSFPTTALESPADDLTKLLMQLKTKRNLNITPDVLRNIIDNIAILQKDEAFAPLRDYLKEQNILVQKNGKVSLQEDKTTLHNALITFKEEMRDTLENEEYKKRYSQQMIIGVALLEGVSQETINTIYGQDVVVNYELQKLLKDNNVTLMDTSYNDTILGAEDKKLFLYTMLFLHDGKSKNQKARHDTKYYKIQEGSIDITPYGRKSYEQAFNCAWQIYNDIYGKTTERKPHYAIHSEDDIYNLYKDKETLSSHGNHIDKEEKTLVLNMTRALLHMQAHKKFDYTNGSHDPEGNIKYHEGRDRKEIYGEQINILRDKEVLNFFTNEVSYLNMKDRDGNTSNVRTPDTYDAKAKSWVFKDIIFNGVSCSFTGRSKGLMSRVIKLINDPKYKQGKSVTDSIANSFYTKNQRDSLRVWIGLIEQFPQNMLDKARFDIKGEESWRLFLNEISDGKNLLSDASIRENFAKYGLSEKKGELLMNNKTLKEAIRKKLDGKSASEIKRNEKTHDSYEEFKLVTSNGTEYQCIQRSVDEIISKNEHGMGLHAIYDFKKTIESKLRPNNSSMTFSSHKIEQILENVLQKEEEYLLKRARTLGLLTQENEESFDPWKAVFYQLLDEEIRHYDKESDYEFIKDGLDKDGLIALTKEQKYEAIRNKKKSYFIDENDSQSGQNDTMKSIYKPLVKERCYNLLQKNYVGAVSRNKEGKLAYILSKKGTNRRLLTTQREGKKIFDRSRS